MYEVCTKIVIDTQIGQNYGIYNVCTNMLFAKSMHHNIDEYEVSTKIVLYTKQAQDSD